MHVEATSAGMGFKRSMRGVRANQIAKEVASDIEESMHTFEDVMRASFSIAKERAKRVLSQVIERYESQIPDEDVIDQLKAQCEQYV